MMEEALLRFSHIGDQILKHLNNEDYINCREISETFKSFIDNQKLLSVRIIERYINSTDEWQTFLKKSRKGEIFEVAQAVKCLPDDETPIDVTPLQCAAMFGNCKILKKWLEYLPSEMDHQYEKVHPLEFAASYGQLEAYILIVEKFADKNPQDSNGLTPLHQAAAQGHYHICQWILHNVKNNHPRDKIFDETPLECAAENGHVAICELIMNESKNDVSNGVPNDTYTKALGVAAQKGHSKVFESIIGEIKKRKLFAYMIESNVLRGALLVAIRRGHSEVFESIICEIKKMKSFYSIHNYEFEGLYLAVVHGHLKMCQFIIENWDVDHPIKKEGIELLYRTASKNGHKSICEYFKSNVYFREMLSSKHQCNK